MGKSYTSVIGRVLCTQEEVTEPSPQHLHQKDDVRGPRTRAVARYRQE